MTIVQNNSVNLPTAGSGERKFKKMGIKLGLPYLHDPLFRPAILPEGWTIMPDEQRQLLSYLCDPSGERRAAIFYNPYFQCRDARIKLLP